MRIIALRPRTQRATGDLAASASASRPPPTSRARPTPCRPYGPLIPKSLPPPRPPHPARVVRSRAVSVMEKSGSADDPDGSPAAAGAKTGDVAAGAKAEGSNRGAGTASAHHQALETLLRAHSNGSLGVLQQAIASTQQAEEGGELGGSVPRVNSLDVLGRVLGVGGTPTPRGRSTGEAERMSRWLVWAFSTPSTYSVGLRFGSSMLL